MSYVERDGLLLGVLHPLELGWWRAEPLTDDGSEPALRVASATVLGAWGVLKCASARRVAPGDKRTLELLRSAHLEMFGSDELFWGDDIEGE